MYSAKLWPYVHLLTQVITDNYIYSAELIYTYGPI